ncbi:hypothetical protein R3P38DRAFT_2933347 [Favolaschia claudopus]|uniref:GATA-type domain-containing protein n=1 Tax=Favolaschia claudopus TaxID=2862362 RepID=A0AAW0BVF6_9AGAR
MVSTQLSMSLPTSFPFTFAPPNDKEAPYSPTCSPYEDPYRQSPPLTPSIHFWSSPSPASSIVPAELGMDRHSSFHDCAHEHNDMVPGISWDQLPTPTSLPTSSFEQPHFWTRTAHVRDRDAQEQEPLEGGGLSGGDAVNAAFLQLLDSQEVGRKDEHDVLKLLLRKRFFPPHELLKLVDWRQLRSLATRSVSWLVDSATACRHPGYSPKTLDASLVSQWQFDEHPFLYNLQSSSPALPSTGHTDVNLIPRCPSPLISTDNSLNHALKLSPSTPSQVPLFVEAPSPPPVAVSPPLLPDSLPSNFLVLPASNESPPTLDLVNPIADISPTITITPPSSITPDIALHMESTPPPHPDNLHDLETSSTHIITAAADTPLAPKRRCEHCQTENTAQWRTHPEKDGHLCNACGQYLLRQGKPRPLDTINQAKLRPPRAAKDDFLVTPPRNVVPEKRGGEVIMRVFSKSARRHSHSGETSIDVDPAS